MDYDFLTGSFLASTTDVIAGFRDAIESSTPPEADLERLCERLRAYEHCRRLPEEFVIGAVDGSGEYPLLQQDDVFLHFATASRTCYETASHRQHKLTALDEGAELNGSFVILRDEMKFVRSNYREFLNRLTGLDLSDLVAGSDYCEVFNAVGRKSLSKGDVTWKNMALSKASQVATHAYLIRSIAELGMAIRLLEEKPRYILLDTSLVYFLLGESIYLPELMKRYLITRANAQGTGVIAINKSHNIPNGDLVGRTAMEKHGLPDHWYLRLPTASLGEEPLDFLKDKEIPPKLGVSYLFKFHAASFPMRIDVDAEWWKSTIGGDEGKERRFFEDLDYTCHDVRSYGYPYPLHAAHRRSSLTKQERKAIKDIMLQKAQEQGLLRGAGLNPQMEAHGYV